MLLHLREVSFSLTEYPAVDGIARRRRGKVDGTLRADLRVFFSFVHAVPPSAASPVLPADQAKITNLESEVAHLKAQNEKQVRSSLFSSSLRVASLSTDPSRSSLPLLARPSEGYHCEVQGSIREDQNWSAAEERSEGFVGRWRRGRRYGGNECWWAWCCCLT